jgi:lysophospholipase L1-like esterase
VRNFPSKNAISVTLIAVVVYLTIDFHLKSKKDFFQLNYDWKSKQVLKVIGGINLDSLSYDFVNLNLPKNKSQFEETLNSYYSFALDNRYYFRCSSIIKNGNKVAFNGVFWINEMPKKSYQPNELIIIEMPLAQNGNRTVCMLGDSYITWREGKNTRKYIAKSIPEIKFIGNNRDVFGYPYQASTLNNTDNVIDHLEELPYSDTFILFIGAHEKNPLETEENLTKIISFLLSKASNLVLVIPPAYETKEADKILRIIKSTYFRYKEYDKVKIIDLSIMLSIPDRYLMRDGIHLNKAGHERLAEYLIRVLKQDEEGIQ